MEKTKQLYTILGAGGSVGNALTALLLENKKAVRLVSRSAVSRDGAESVRGDLTDLAGTIEAVKGSDVVFLCAGLPYDTKVWSELWPKIMSNTIEACKAGNAKLIFLDNVYSYGKVSGRMTEDTPYNACSRKGAIRVKIAEQLQAAMKQGSIEAIIARAADWYGPYGTKTSVPQLLVIDRLRRGQAANWLVNPDAVHSYSYIPDCARGLLLLADDAPAFNQVWHLPTSDPPINGRAFIEIAAKELGVAPRTVVLRKWMMRLAGLGDRTIREAYEMLYQSEFDYYFDSSKFNRHFNYVPMPYQEGIVQTIRFKELTQQA
jgi:nucleoside-diphosphate-sugar epimerase